MFDEKLFFDLCKKYDVDMVKSKGKAKICENRCIRDINGQDIRNIFNTYQTYFDYSIATLNKLEGSYQTYDSDNSDEYLLAC